MGRGGQDTNHITSVVGDFLSTGRPRVEEEEESEQRSFSEIGEERASHYLIVTSGREAERFLGSDEARDDNKLRQQLAGFVALLAGAQIYFKVASDATSRPGSVLLSLALFDYLDKPSKKGRQELAKMVRLISNSAELEIITSDSSNKIDYLQKCWGDDTVKKISQATGTQAATVRRWVAGHEPSYHNGYCIGLLVEALYQLQEGVGLSRQEAVRWIEEPRKAFEGSSAIESLGEWQFISQLREEIRKLGGII